MCLPFTQYLYGEPFNSNTGSFAHPVVELGKFILMEMIMQALKERIQNEGKNLGDGILKVDSFINHQVDPLLMDACGREFAERFKNLGATKVLTAEISGIAPALLTALHLKLPVVYARKSKPITMPDQVFLTLAPSHTKGRTIELIVSPEFLAEGDKVLIIDDFLSTGADHPRTGAAGAGGRRGSGRDRHADRKNLRRRTRKPVLTSWAFRWKRWLSSPICRTGRSCLLINLGKALCPT